MQWVDRGARSRMFAECRNSDFDACTNARTTKSIQRQESHHARHRLIGQAIQQFVDQSMFVSPTHQPIKPQSLFRLFGSLAFTLLLGIQLGLQTRVVIGRDEHGGCIMSDAVGALHTDLLFAHFFAECLRSHHHVGGRVHPSLQGQLDALLESRHGRLL